jgi:signal peptidase I
MSRRKIIISGSVATVLALAILYYFLFLQLVIVPTGAMSGTILPGDRPVVNKLFSDIRRGEIVVFKHPETPSVRYVKRVIALPGETIEIRDDSVFINGQKLPERRVFISPEDLSGAAPPEVVKEEEMPQGAQWTVYYYLMLRGERPQE